MILRLIRIPSIISSGSSLKFSFNTVLRRLALVNHNAVIAYYEDSIFSSAGFADGIKR